MARPEPPSRGPTEIPRRCPGRRVSSGTSDDLPPRPLPRAHTDLEADPGASFHRPVLLVDVRCDRSPVHGLGVFAAAPIPAGTPVWRFVEGFDQVFPATHVASLPAPARRHLEHYGFLDAGTGRWFLDADLAIFMNHSDAPNTGSPEAIGPARETRALRDIAAGEELTCDYRAFDGSAKPIPRLRA